MPLSDVEIRVLGSLLEKERTTPDAYPLSSQALLAACNQKSAREPTMRLHLRDVEDAVVRLRERGLAATVRASGDRVPKHRQRLAERLDLSVTEAALLAVLMLRGAQTASELRSRTARVVQIPDAAAAESHLERLADRPAPLTRNVGRGPGQSQDRWVHTLGEDEERLQPRARRPEGDEASDAADGRSAAPSATGATGATGAAGAAGATGSTSAAAAGPAADELARLHERIAQLERRVALLEAALDGTR